MQRARYTIHGRGPCRSSLAGLDRTSCSNALQPDAHPTGFDLSNASVEWFKAINSARTAAKIAVLLVTPDFIHTNSVVVVTLHEIRRRGKKLCPVQSLRIFPESLSSSNRTPVAPITATLTYLMRNSIRCRLGGSGRLASTRLSGFAREVLEIEQQLARLQGLHPFCQNARPRYMNLVSPQGLSSRCLVSALHIIAMKRGS